MYPFKKTIIALGLGVALGANAETVYGPCKYDKATLSSLTCYGPAFLNKTTIHGELKVMGPLSLEKSTVDSLNVKGVANISRSTINGNVSVYGPISAEETTFNGSIFSATSILKLTSSYVKGDVSIEVGNETPLLQLNHTTLNGNVIFTKKAGEVEVNNGSSITGKITNENKK